MVDVAHDGHHRRAGPLVRVVLFVLFFEEPGQQLGFLLLAGVDQAHLGADLSREEFDHVVGQRLGRHHHLPLQQQEADDVTGAPVQLGAEVASGGTALDDDLAVGHRGRGRLVRRELCRLELFEVAPTAPGPALGRAATRHAATTTTRRRGTGRGSSTGTAGETAAATGTGAAVTTATGWTTSGTTGTGGRTAAGTCRVATAASGPAGRAGTASTHAGRGWWDGASARAAMGGRGAAAAAGWRGPVELEVEGRAGAAVRPRSAGGCRRQREVRRPRSGPVQASMARRRSRRPWPQEPPEERPVPRDGQPGQVPERRPSAGATAPDPTPGREPAHRRCGSRGARAETDEDEAGAGAVGRAGDQAGGAGRRCLGRCGLAGRRRCGPGGCPRRGGGGLLGRGRSRGLFGRDLSAEALGVGLAADAVGLGVLNGGRNSAHDPDTQGQGEVEPLLVGET